MLAQNWSQISSMQSFCQNADDIRDDGLIEAKHHKTS